MYCQIYKCQLYKYCYFNIKVFMNPKWVCIQSLCSPQFEILLPSEQSHMCTERAGLLLENQKNYEK